MNLGKLLSVGKSIFGNREAAAYRLNRRMCLPKFNDGKNPFVPKAAEPQVEKAVGAVVAPATGAAQKSPPPYAFKPKPVRTGRRLMTAAAPGLAAAKSAKSGWTARLNPFRTPEPEPEAERPEAVQPELSLNAIKVMHNDLADADVEMVPMKSHAEAVVSAPVLPPARRAWEYLGENLVKG